MSAQGSLEESLEAAGGVSSNIVEAFRAVLQDSSLDGAFVSAAITLPASTELRDDIPNLNPLLLYQVRCSPDLHVASAVLVVGMLPHLFGQADMMLWTLHPVQLKHSARDCVAVLVCLGSSAGAAGKRVHLTITVTVDMNPSCCAGSTS